MKLAQQSNWQFFDVEIHLVDLKKRIFGWKLKGVFGDIKLVSMSPPLTQTEMRNRQGFSETEFKLLR